MNHVYLNLQHAPPILGLRFRQFAGESDFAEMAEVMNVIARDDGTAAFWNPQVLALMDAWIHDFDPPRDRVMIEVGGRMIGAARVQSSQELDGKRIYMHSCSLHPDWRGKGIEQAVLHHNETRLHEIAAKHPNDGPRFFQSYGVAEKNVALASALRERKYEPIRHSYEMVRPNLENIADAKLPPGVETRPVREEHLRKIWDAHLEAFRDHWGYVEPPQSAFETWMQNPDWDRNLSRIAWQGDEVVGQVLIFVPHSHNATAAKKRADTEAICVRRPWRKKGVATALIAQCLHALRDAGFDEAALGVDTQNTSGALRIYERMGYEPVVRYTRYQKSM